MWAGEGFLPCHIEFEGGLQQEVQLATLFFTSHHPKALWAESILSFHSPCKMLARRAWDEWGQAKGHYTAGLDLCSSYGLHLLCWK